MILLSSAKNRSHLLRHHIPEVLIHISRTFRADADAPHATDAFLKDGVLRVSYVNGADGAFPGECAERKSHNDEDYRKSFHN